MQVEINNHEHRIDTVSHSAQLMVEDNHFATEDIKTRLGLLHDHWNQLKEKSVQRKQDLEDSLQVRLALSQFAFNFFFNYDYCRLTNTSLTPMRQSLGSVKKSHWQEILTLERMRMRLKHF